MWLAISEHKAIFYPFENNGRRKIGEWNELLATIHIGLAFGIPTDTQLPADFVNHERNTAFLGLKFLPVTKKVDGHGIVFFDVYVPAGTTRPYRFMRTLAFVIQTGTVVANSVHKISPF